VFALKGTGASAGVSISVPAAAGNFENATTFDITTIQLKGSEHFKDIKFVQEAAVSFTTSPAAASAKFTAPVTITLPLPANWNETSDVPKDMVTTIALWDATKFSWVPQAGTKLVKDGASAKVTVDVMHFSVYAVVYAPAGGAPPAPGPAPADDDSGLGAGAVVGIIIAVIGGIALIGVVGVVLKNRTAAAEGHGTEMSAAA
jgi:hypothetical protein